MSIERYPDWPERLFGFFDSRRQEPFAWGKNDCATFFADAVLATTGRQIGDEFRTYATALGSVRIINSAGGYEGLLAKLGFERIGLPFCTRGDIVIASIEGVETFGVVAGNGFYFAPGPDGMVARPMAEAVSAFRF